MGFRPSSAALIAAAATQFVVGGCTPLPERYVNSLHPEYGATQFATDVGRCRDRAATQVVTTLAGYYPPQSGVEVNDAELGACMARSGWQTAPPSVHPLW
jgi:hypothetical protein